MRPKLLILGTLITAFAAANPMTVTVSGMGSGSLGGKTFTAAAFTLTLNSDTTLVTKPACCNTLDLPSASPATLTIQGLGTATLMDTQTVFVDPGTYVIGFAHFNDGDLVDLSNVALSGYRFGGSIGPLTGTPSFVGGCPGVDCTSFQTSAGAFNFSSVSSVTFTITVGSAAPPAITKIVEIAAASTHFAPGMPIDIIGMNLGGSTTDAATFTIGGKPAPVLFFANSTHVTVQIPVDAALGNAAVVATYKGIASAASTITIDALAPAISVNADALGSPTFFDASGQVINASHPAIASSLVYFIAVGLGPTNPAQVTGSTATVSAPTTLPVQLMIGNKLVTPEYAGLFVGGLPGTYKILFKPPQDVAIGSQPVVLSVGGKSSNTATLIVGPPVPSITAVLNGATFKAKGAAPNSFVSIFGTNFGTQDTPASIFPATVFNGLSVLFNGTPAPLYYVFGSLGQINLVLPSELPETGTVNVQVKTSQGTSAGFPLHMAPADVGMFRIPDPSKPSRNNGAVLFANTVWRVMPASMATAIGFLPCDGLAPAVACGQPAASGDAILIFLTGEGKATPNGDPAGQPIATGSVAPTSGTPLYRTVQTPTVTVGGIPAQAVFSGISPGNAGLYQINTTVPDGVQPGDDVPVVVTMPGGSTDTVTIAVRTK